jgi:prephenate dehydratase
VGYLKDRYPGAEVVPCNSTARAAQLALEDDGEALAICSPKCAEVYGLEVVDTDIQDGGEGESGTFWVRMRR